jgi:predicted N-acetyltransferase YhbS
MKLRAGVPEDANECGTVCFHAFKSIAERHNMAPEFSSLEAALSMMPSLLADPDFYSVVAERDGAIVGSNFLDMRGPIVGVGPISVRPDLQNVGLGRQLMQNVLDRVEASRRPGVRLYTAAHNTRTVSLYSKLGFSIRGAAIVVHGPPLGQQQNDGFFRPHLRVRVARPEDLPATKRLCMRVHGHDRDREVAQAVQQGTARVVERAGEIAGYVTSLSFAGHAVASTNEELQALIAAATDLPAPGFLVPAVNTELFTWCLDNGMRMQLSMYHMTIGLYNTPNGVYLPSVWY